MEQEPITNPDTEQEKPVVGGIKVFRNGIRTVVREGNIIKFYFKDGGPLDPDIEPEAITTQERMTEDGPVLDIFDNAGNKIGSEVIKPQGPAGSEL